MASATDIITYVGVPLAVLGVMPILWNAVKGIRIYQSLKGSIPHRARKYIELTPDLAGGVVSVTVDPLFFNSAILFDQLRDSTEKALRNTRAGPRAAFAHRTHYIVPVAPRGMAASWMGLLAADVPIIIDRHRDVQRFVVDAAMRGEVIQVTCDWHSFVFLALAVGTDPSDPGLMALGEGHTGIFELKTESANDQRGTMTVTNQNGSLFASLSLQALKVSWRAAYAWSLTMIFVYGPSKTLFIVPLLDQALRTNSKGMAFSGLDRYPSLDIEQMDLGKSSHVWADALTWTLYTEDVFHEPGQMVSELLPVPQYLLRLRENALRDLQACVDLDHKLEAIFPNKHSLKDKIMKAIRGGWNDQLHVENVETTVRSYNENPPGYADIWQDLQSVALFNELYATYGPSTFGDHQEPPEALDESTLMGVLARIIIATSVIQKWRRQEWPKELILDGKDAGKEAFTIPPNPVGQILRPSPTLSTAVYLS